MRQLRAVLFDRDGTLVVDVPYNGDPDLVEVVPGAADAVQAVRDAGLQIAMVTNQSGVARGLISMQQVASVNARVEALLGPLGPWCICPHGPDDGCPCRKPRPGLIVRAAEILGVATAECVVIGDRAADMGAAAAAGAAGVLIDPAAVAGEGSRPATLVARDLPGAVELIFRGR